MGIAATNQPLSAAPPLKGAVDRRRLSQLMDREIERFRSENPKSQELFESAEGSLVGGVPMQWMIEWPGSFPLFVRQAKGVTVTDVDGHDYLDFCLGDTGAMFGHSPDPVAKAVVDQASRGLTFMMPTEDAAWIGKDLSRRFGLPFWQFAMTATDANRFALRLARDITGRPKVLVFEGCYHGTVDETIATVENGKVVSRGGNVGPPSDLAETTRVVEFNDLDGLAAELAKGDVACVLTEPALTNHSGIVLPDPGFHEALRALTKKHDVLLIIDETHTISSGPGGYTAAHGLEPDMLTIGKPLAGGIPVAVYGFTADIAAKIKARTIGPGTSIAGIGGTLTANALALGAMRAALEYVITEQAFAHMIPLAEQLAGGVEGVIREYDLDWYVTRIGARVEYRFQPTAPKNGSEALLGKDGELDRFIHLYFLNRGILVTPMHNMLLTSPKTTAEHVDRHTTVFNECVGELLNASP
ncbi:MAG: aspartate aminotransferase family protein [Rhodospirillaceae bacterium]|nr:aspartate aminotransferase family protein [Rhodospirillaceae bacterium]